MAGDGPDPGLGLDLEAGLRHCGGKPGLYLRLLEIFLSDHLIPFETRWTDGRRSGDSRAVRRLVHTFKGVSLSVGAVSMGRLAEALEAALAGEDSEAIDRMAVGLLEGLSVLREEVDRARAHLAAPRPGTAPSPLLPGVA